jgi:Tfp pilus assembly protein PilF
VGRKLRFTFCLFAAAVAATGCQTPPGGQSVRPSSSSQSWNPIARWTSSEKAKVPDWRTPDQLPKDSLSLDRQKKPGANLFVKAAQLCEVRGQSTKAIANYNKALEIDSQDLPALLGLARVYNRLDQPNQAVTLYETAVSCHPENSTIFNDLGLCYARQRRWNDALSNYYKAIRLQPENPRYRNNIARVLVITGRPDDALQHLNTAFPAAIARYNVGYLAQSVGDVATANKFLRLAIEADPRMLPARDMLATISRPAVGPQRPISPRLGVP